jgi:outer membrane protein assembly factor BamB
MMQLMDPPTSALRNSMWAVRPLGLLLLLAVPRASGGESIQTNWPQWRGPDRNSLIVDAAPWPKDLSNLNRRWRVELEQGYSGPIVWEDRVFVCETHAATDEVVRALDRATGKEIWRASWKGSMSVPFFAKKNGDWIRATPACDGESLFVAGMRDVLVCLNNETGFERWRVDFPAKLKTQVPSFGFVSSPLVIGEYVYVQAGGGFIKLNKKTGEIIWRTLADGGGMSSAFSSPVSATIHGVPQLVVQMREKLAGVVPETGDVLWSQVVPSYRGMNILTPTVFANGVFTSSHKNKTFFYRIDKKDDVFHAEEAWTTSGQGYMSSPVVIDEHAYLHLGNGRLCCLDLRTGQQVWRSKQFGEYWSMVANGDRILALNERGELLLVAADVEQFRLLDRKEIADSESWAHLAVCGHELFVRDLKGISALSWN